MAIGEADADSAREIRVHTCHRGTANIKHAYMAKRPWQVSSLQSLLMLTNALSIRPQGLRVPGEYELLYSGLDGT